MEFSSLLLFLRYALLRIFQLLGVLLFLVLPLLLVYLRFYGLPATINRQVENSLSGKFFEVRVEHLYFSLRRGFIAKNLCLLERKPGHRLLVHAKRLSFLPKLAPLLSGHLAVDSFSLHGTTIDIPLGHGEEPRLHFDHVSASIISPQEKLVLEHARFQVAGVHVEAKGTFLHPQAFAPNPVPQQGPGKIAQTIELIEKELQSIHWEGESGRIMLQASGDLADNNSLKIDQLRLHSGPLEYRGWHLRGVQAEMNYAQGLLGLNHFFLEDRVGRLQLSGEASFPKHQAELYFSGRTELLPLLKILRPKLDLKVWDLIDIPSLQGKLHADWSDPQPKLTGRAEFSLGRFFYHGVRMQRLVAGVAIREKTLLVRNLIAEGDPGKLQADVMLAPEQNRMRIQASLWPQFLAPAIEGNFQQFLKSYDCEEPMSFSFEGSAPDNRFDHLAGNGHLELGRSAIRNAWIDHLQSEIGVKNGVISFQKVLVTDGERKAEGSCSFNPAEKIVTLPQVDSNIDPLKIMEWIDPKIVEVLLAYRFSEPPQLEVKGQVGTEDPQKNNLQIAIQSVKQIGYTLLHRDFSFTNVAGNVGIKGEHIDVSLPQATLFGGGIALELQTSAAHDNKVFTAKVDLSDVDLKKLTQLCFHYDDSQGKLSGTYQFRAVTDDNYGMQGEGNLSINNGNVLSLPIFGPLSSLMNEIIPGLGYQVAHRATARFSVQHGTITSRNISIQSTAFSLIGDGVIFYLEDRMRMNVRLNVKGIPGIVFFPVSKLFEYTSKGSLEHPDWHPKFVPIPKIPLPRKN